MCKSSGRQQAVDLLDSQIPACGGPSGSRVVCRPVLPGRGDGRRRKRRGTMSGGEASVLRGGGGEPERMLLDLGDASPQIREESCPHSPSANTDADRRNAIIYRTRVGVVRGGETSDGTNWTQGNETHLAWHLLVASFRMVRLGRFWNEPGHGRTPSRKIIRRRRP